MVWEKVYFTLRRNYTTTCLTKSHAGRVNAVQRTLNWGAWALGSFASALLISIFGLQITLFIGGFGTTLCLVALLRRGILKGTDIEYTSSF